MLFGFAPGPPEETLHLVQSHFLVNDRERAAEECKRDRCELTPRPNQSRSWSLTSLSAILLSQLVW